jgi:hypothetical protein
VAGILAVLIALAILAGQRQSSSARRASTAPAAGSPATTGSPRRGDPSSDPELVGPEDSLPGVVGRTTIVGRIWQGHEDCEGLAVVIDGEPVEAYDGEFGKIVEDGEHEVELRVRDTTVARWSHLVPPGAQWDLGEVSVPLRKVTFRGPRGRALALEIGGRVSASHRGSNLWGRRYIMTGEATLTLGCHDRAALALDEQTHQFAQPIALPDTDGVVELRFAAPAIFRCTPPSPDYIVYLRSEDVPEASFQGVDGTFEVPPGRYAIETGSAGMQATVVESAVAGAVVELVSGQSPVCDPSLFADLGSIEVVLSSERMVDRAYFWIGDESAEPTTLDEMFRMGSPWRGGGNAFGPVPIEGYRFHRVPWLTATVCVGVTKWRDQMVPLENEDVEIVCRPVSRATVRKSTRFELSLAP